MTKFLFSIVTVLNFYLPWI